MVSTRSPSGPSKFWLRDIYQRGRISLGGTVLLLLSRCPRPVCSFASDFALGPLKWVVVPLLFVSFEINTSLTGSDDEGGKSPHIGRRQLSVDLGVLFYWPKCEKFGPGTT